MYIERTNKSPNRSRSVRGPFSKFFQNVRGPFSVFFAAGSRVSVFCLEGSMSREVEQRFPSPVGWSDEQRVPSRRGSCRWNCGPYLCGCSPKWRPNTSNHAKYLGRRSWHTPHEPNGTSRSKTEMRQGPHQGIAGSPLMKNREIMKDWKESKKLFKSEVREPLYINELHFCAQVPKTRKV